MKLEYLIAGLGDWCFPNLRSSGSAAVVWVGGPVVDDEGEASTLVVVERKGVAVAVELAEAAERVRCVRLIEGRFLYFPGAALEGDGLDSAVMQNNLLARHSRWTVAVPLRVRASGAGQHGDERQQEPHAHGTQHPRMAFRADG